MTYAQIVTEDRRLCILRLLRDAPGASVNHYVLQTALDALGHKVSRDAVRADAAWLAEQGLADMEAVNEIAVLTLTGRGDDVAAGRAFVPGIKKPVPGE